MGTPSVLSTWAFSVPLLSSFEIEDKSPESRHRLAGPNSILLHSDQIQHSFFKLTTNKVQP